MNDTKTDVLIIGGGVLGAFSAYFALEKGLSVRLIERDSRPNSASVRNFGQIVPSGMSNRWLEYGQKSVATYLSIQSVVDISVRQTGSYYIANTESEMAVLYERYEQLNALGWRSEILTSEAVIQKIPAVRKKYCIGAMYCPPDCIADPRKLVHQLLQYLTNEKSLRYHPNTLAVSVSENSESVTVTDAYGNHYQAAQLIICNGADYKTLFPKLFHDAGFKVCKLHMFTVKPQTNVKLPGAILTGLTIRRYEGFHHTQAWKNLPANEVPAALRENGIHILFKQSADGSVIIGDSHHYALSSDSESEYFGFDINWSVHNLILEAAKEIMQFDHWDIQSVWSGYYAVAPENLPIFDKKISARTRIITGIGGKGMTTGCGYIATHLFDD
jgi:FAD dependent oxidoreductase TIGR03364